MKKIHTAVRAPQEWVKDVDKWAKKHGVSRNSAIVLLATVAMEAMENLTIGRKND